VTYCYRGRLRSGDYHFFLHQSIGIDAQENKLERVFGIECDIHHITTENNRKISFLGIDGKPSYTDLDVYKAKEFIPLESFYTTREIEIIRLLSEGPTGLQISNRLSISYDTVRSHRKNILEKSGCRNTTAAVARAIREGVI
jgi:DNA-binding NarL/FixJ family response regulator